MGSACWVPSTATTQGAIANPGEEGGPHGVTMLQTPPPHSHERVGLETPPAQARSPGSFCNAPVLATGS